MAHEGKLAGRKILVVEDEYLVAVELADAIRDFGAEVIGPVGDFEEALTLVKATPEIHAAIMNVNLGRGTSYPIADALTDRGIPFALVTGYGREHLPERFSKVTLYEKPADVARVLTQLFS